MLEMPLYQYTMEILVDEECCLLGQPLWYKGASDGWTWTARVAHQMSYAYRGR
jgi:hypothetical protein